MVGLVCMLLLSASEAPDGGAPPAELSAGPFVSYLEWVLDVRLSVAERDEAAALVARVEAGKSAEDRRLVQRAIELEAERSSYSPNELTGLRWSVEDEYLKTLRNRHRGSQVAQWILRLKAQATRPVASGKPALTRHAADCLAELSSFVASEAGGPPVAADATARDGFARQLSLAWPRLSTEQRAAVAAVPAEWARLRALWSSAAEEQRGRLRETWRAVPAKASGPVELAVGLAALAPGWQ